MQLKAGKALLACSSRMPDEVVRGELGWMSMDARRDMMKLRFFGRLVRMKEQRVVRKMFVSCMNQVDHKNPVTPHCKTLHIFSEADESFFVKNS